MFRLQRRAVRILGVWIIVTAVRVPLKNLMYYRSHLFFLWNSIYIYKKIDEYLKQSDFHKYDTRNKSLIRKKFFSIVYFHIAWFNQNFKWSISIIPYNIDQIPEKSYLDEICSNEYSSFNYCSWVLVIVLRCCPSGEFMNIIVSDGCVSVIYLWTLSLLLIIQHSFILKVRNDKYLNLATTLKYLVYFWRVQVLVRLYGVFI